MSNPGSFGGLAPRSHDWLVRKVLEQDKKINQLMTHRTMESAAVGQGGIRSADFDGTLSPAAAGTTGWGLSGSTGDAVFNNLVLRGGIITDDALSSRIGLVTGAGTSSGAYAIPQTVGLGADTIQVAVDLTVPDGFTEVNLFAAVQDVGVRTSGAAFIIEWFYSCVNVGTAGADAASWPSTPVSGNTLTTASVMHTANITGLSGGDTVSVQSRPYATTADWTSDSRMASSLIVLAFFSR